MTNYIQRTWRTVRTDFGGTVTAGAIVKADVAQGAGVLAATTADEEICGIALDDQSDGEVGTVVVAGIALFKAIGQLDAMESVMIHTAVDSVDTATAVDLIFGRTLDTTAGAVTTRTVRVMFDFSSGGEQGLAE